MPSFLRRKKYAEKALPRAARARVIVDCRDQSQDYWIDKERAKALYENGQLDWDVTNGAYCEKVNGRRTIT